MDGRTKSSTGVRRVLGLSTSTLISICQTIKNVKTFFSQRRKAMFLFKKIITIILLVLTLGGLLAGKWVGPFLSKILSNIISTPVGAVLTTIALIVFVITIINFIINLARIKT